MAILDKLVEKKDILAYCDFRIKQLQIALSQLSTNCKPKSREQASKLLHGRIKELTHLRGVIHKGIKAESIKISLDVYEYKNGKREEK
jgi:hypothetical protein